MGIQGLLGILKECQTSTHIKNYKGQTLGVDAYVWLHRGAYGCAQELATGQQTVKYVKYAMHRVRMLKHHGIKPYIVFDGGLLPSKLHTESDREARRAGSLKQALSLAAEGKHAQARDYFNAAVDVTPQMAYQLIKALKAEDVPYVVAPYEADAQLAYLESKGFIDGIITEDSDLLVFGCKQVLFKLDSEGACVEIKRENLTMCKKFSFSGWTETEFRHMAILSGCDYLKNIEGLGINTAHKLMRTYKSVEKVLQFVRFEGRLKVPQNYKDEFKRAEYTFLFQRVFCPEQQKLVHCTPLPDHLQSKVAEIESINFIGPALSPELAVGIARGDICPISKEAMIDIAPDHLAAPAARPRASNASIKDFFTAKPVSKPKPTKKVKESRSTASNLFRPKTSDEPAQKAKPVQSRFFGKPLPTTAGSSKQASDASPPIEQEEIQENGNAVLRDPEQSLCDRMQDDDPVLSEEDLSSLHHNLEEQMGITADVGSNGESASSHSDEMKVEQALKVEPLTPRKSAPQWPLKSASPRAPLSETGFSHISSPLNIDQAMPAVKANASEEDSGFYEPENGSGGICILSSPVLSSPPKAQVTLFEAGAMSPARGHLKIAHASGIQPIRSPPRRKPSSQSVIASTEIASVKSESGGPRPSRSSSSVSLSSPPAPVQSKRQNAIVAPSLNKGKKRKSSIMVADDIDVEQEDSLLDDKLKSVMSSWRERFSASAARSRSSTPSMAFRSQSKRPASSTPQPAAPVLPVSTDSKSNKRIKLSSKASSSDIDMQDEQEPIVESKPSLRSIAPTSTSSRLEAFRFRSVNSLQSSSGSSSSVSSQS